MNITQIQSTRLSFSATAAHELQFVLRTYIDNGYVAYRLAGQTFHDYRLFCIPYLNSQKDQSHLQTVLLFLQVEILRLIVRSPFISVNL